jgi:hypothetical protein
MDRGAGGRGVGWERELLNVMCGPTAVGWDKGEI